MSYSSIGKITGTHGLDGRVVLHHQLDDKQIWNKLPHIFIELRRESYIPYFIEERKVTGPDEVLLKLDEVDSVELARSLSGKQVYLEDSVFNKLKPKAVSANMIGFRIADRKVGELGIIDDLFETPGQVLATVQYKGREVMIPLVDATIVGIDVARKLVQVDLPDGLLEVYL
ncbi:ribosome maturation factor RimM [Taibaiella koreensis]|uniref:ribosome maturation factor RimM n=1 Tax=Taibaiella koreensis TaxID=1268548 RepID=UPI000E59F717|nr:ribosome maturation factor RimM [Taibaiella koreensis]